MEKNCVYCNRTIHPDEVHYKFGNVHVCAQCGAIHTIRDVCNAFDTGLRVSPVTIEVGETAEESSLTGKTVSPINPVVAYDVLDTYSNIPVRDSDGNTIPWDSDMYARAANEYGILGEHIPAHVKADGFFRYPEDFPEIAAEESSLTGKTESDGPVIELDKSKLNAEYGVAAMRMFAEENSLSGKTESDAAAADTADIPEYYHDAENMSEEDYVSKYADNPAALEYWVTANS